MRRSLSAFDAAAFRARLTLAVQYRATTHSTVAYEAGVNQCSVTRIMQGKGMPDIENYFRLCNWLGVSPAEFAARNGGGT